MFDGISSTLGANFELKVRSIVPRFMLTSLPFCMFLNLMILFILADRNVENHNISRECFALLCLKNPYRFWNGNMLLEY